MSLHNSFWKYRFICQILPGFAKYNLLKVPDESSMICVMDSSVQVQIHRYIKSLIQSHAVF